MTTYAERIRLELSGIDQTEIANDDGWWETDAGATFGRGRLAVVMAIAAEADAEIARLREQKAQ